MDRWLPPLYSADQWTWTLIRRSEVNGGNLRPITDQGHSAPPKSRVVSPYNRVSFSLDH